MPALASSLGAAGLALLPFTEQRRAFGDNDTKKLPKRFVFVDAITRSPAGKADYRWARETALASLNC